MITGKENLIKWMELHKAPMWKLSVGPTKEKVIAECEDVQTSDEAMQRLDAALKILSPGRYHIACKMSEKQVKGMHETFFVHTDTPSNANAISGPYASLTPAGLQDHINSEAKKLLDSYIEKKEKEELKKKLEELEKAIKQGASDPMGHATSNFFKAIEPYAPSIMEHFGFKKTAEATVAISGTGDEKKDDSKQKESAERLEKSLEEIAKADPEGFVKVLEKIAAVAKVDPATYTMYKNLLLNS